MSISIYEAVWCAEFQGMEKLVLLRLAEHAAKDGSSIYPGVESIAAYCGIGEKTVRRALNALKESGVLVLVKSGNLLERTANEYRIDLEKLGVKKNPDLDKKEGKKRRRRKPQKKQIQRPQATENKNGLKTLGGHTDRRTDFALGGHSDRRSAVTQSTLGGHSDRPTRHIEPVIDNPPYGSLRSPDVREDKNPAGENLIRPASQILAGKIEAVGPSQGAFRKAEPKTSAKPPEVSTSSLAGMNGDCRGPHGRQTGAADLVAMHVVAGRQIRSAGFSGDLSKQPPKAKNVAQDQSGFFPAPKPRHAADASGNFPPHLFDPFGDFYDAFPFARDRGAARGAFHRAVMVKRADPAQLVAAARRYAAERAQDQRDRATVERFTTKPAKWLESESWNNAPAPGPAPEAPRFTGLAASRNSSGYEAAKTSIDRLRAEAARRPKTDISGI
jgi:hypothetical protein